MLPQDELMDDRYMGMCVDYALGKQVQMDPMSEWLLVRQLNDPNSSQMREAITVRMCGYSPCPGKHGYDCHDGERNKEVKPKLYTENPKIKRQYKINGSGNFSDYTRERLEKDSSENLGVICSLFYQNRIMYAIEFSFDAVKKKLEERIIKKCEEGKQKYVRSAQFSYLQWMNHESVKVLYMNTEMVRNNPKIFVRKYHKYILSLAGDQ
jgi:hypothetical protein